MMNRFWNTVVFAAVLFGSILFFVAGGSASAEVNVRLPLPRLFFPVPPPLVLIPGTYVYTAPDADADIIFYQGAWYRPHGGLWYMSNGHNGPWRALSPERVPRPLIGLPPNVRRVPPGQERMPYGHVERNWRRWERERHWDAHDKKKRKQDRDDDHDRGHGRGHGEKDHRSD
jgi:hypothetical protein